MGIQINHVILGSSEPVQFDGNLRLAEKLGEADLCLVPWDLLQDNLEVLAEALNVYIQLHSVKKLWVRGRLTQTLQEEIRSKVYSGVDVEVVADHHDHRPKRLSSRLLVACGDGRSVFRQSLRNLHNQLEQPAAVVLPGGPLWLRDHSELTSSLQDWMEAEGVIEVVESRHENCGYRAHCHPGLAERAAAHEEPAVLKKEAQRVWRCLKGSFQPH